MASWNELMAVMGSKSAAKAIMEKAGVPLADTISAEQHTDKEGPTAAIKSYGKLDHAGQTNDTQTHCQSAGRSLRAFDCRLGRSSIRLSIRNCR